MLECYTKDEWNIIGLIFNLLDPLGLYNNANPKLYTNLNDNFE